MTLLWFRRDLRDFDHPLLAIQGDVLPLFIFDTNILSALNRNDRRVALIFEYVVRLKKNLQNKGLDLAIFYGDPYDVIAHLVTKGFTSVVASGDYDSYAQKRDHNICRLLPFEYILDTYIFEPKEVQKDDGTPYHVFTPFYKKAQTLFRPHHAKEYLPSKQNLIPFDYDHLHHITPTTATSTPIALSTLGFTPCVLSPHLLQDPLALLNDFKEKISTYAEHRDFLDHVATSQLSIALRFGTISIRTIIRHLIQWKKEGLPTEPFFRQLMWREFYAMLLFTYPRLEHESFKPLMKPEENTQAFERFCKGETGFPLIDAAITQLLTTGEMHNRARMVVASFFTKDLLLPWQWGERFFAQHLLDYDAASNILSWQWSAGTGIDPQPFFRTFNPMSQTLKYDPHASYITTYLPHLKGIDPKILANDTRLSSLTIEGYPPPMVSHSIASKIALAKYNQTKA